MSETQTERLIDYMLEGHKVDGDIARIKLGIGALRSRISEIGKEIKVHREYVTMVNRFGDKCRYMRYWV